MLGKKVLDTKLRLFVRRISSEHRSLMIEEFGDPSKCVKLIKKAAADIPTKIGSREILVKHLSSCINPGDINTIQGTYGKRPKLPAILGNEGVVKVEQIGEDVKHIKPGDLAVGILSGENWQSYSIRDSLDFFKIDQGLDLRVAAQIKVNPCTAYRLLKDFVPLKPGDVIIQNGANSAVGIYAIQLAKLWGFKTINVIRDKPGSEQVIDDLKSYGADYVLTEKEITNVQQTSIILDQIGPPKILLNCVGGKNATNCQRLVDRGGMLITYGNMSKQPFAPIASFLIFKKHKQFGFWMSEWYEENLELGRENIEKMLNELVELFKNGSLRSKSTTSITFEERELAFSKSKDTKYLFSINEY